MICVGIGLCGFLSEGVMVIGGKGVRRRAGKKSRKKTGQKGGGEFVR